MKLIFAMFCLIFMSINFQNMNCSKTSMKEKVNAKSKLNMKVKEGLKVTVKAKSTGTSLEKTNSKTKDKREDSMLAFLKRNKNKHQSSGSGAGVPGTGIPGAGGAAIPGISGMPQGEFGKFGKIMGKVGKDGKYHFPTKIMKPKDDPDVINERDTDLRLVHEGWLKISNPQLKNINRFPKLLLPDKVSHEIPVMNDYFRANENWDPLGNSSSGPNVYYFWFRLSYKNLYYSLSKDSINVLGNVPVKDITDAFAMKEFARSNKCLRVLDYKKRDWTMCAQTRLERNIWVCKIRALKKFEEYNVCMKRIGAEEIFITKRVTQPIILIPEASPICNENFNYEQKGSDWVCDCKDGREQSPIDLPPADKAIKSPVKPIFDYQEVDFKQVLTTQDGSLKSREHLKIEIKDHALKIKHDNFGKIVTLDGSLYTAQEIVFHTPAEHTIGGRSYDMEMQIIHFGQTTGDLAKQITLSFVFEKTPGFYNQFIDDIDFFTLPNPLNITRDIENKVFIPKIFYNAQSHDVPVMKPFSFFTYQGSLTAPPCTERTIVYVAAEPIKLGTTAIQLFQEALRMPDMMAIPSGNILVSNKTTENNRLTQSRNGRNVFYYDANDDLCIEKPNGKKRKGHYERIDSDVVKYYFVSGPKPSGMPGAFVVSENEAKGKGLLQNNPS